MQNFYAIIQIYANSPNTPFRCINCRPRCTTDCLHISCKRCSSVSISTLQFHNFYVDSQRVQVDIDFLCGLLKIDVYDTHVDAVHNTYINFLTIHKETVNVNLLFVYILFLTYYIANSPMSMEKKKKKYVFMLNIMSNTCLFL